MTATTLTGENHKRVILSNNHGNRSKPMENKCVSMDMEYKGCLTWKRLNNFEEISYNDVAAIYENLKSGVGVERGYKTLKTLETSKTSKTSNTGRRSSGLIYTPPPSKNHNCRSRQSKVL